MTHTYVRDEHGRFIATPAKTERLTFADEVRLVKQALNLANWPTSWTLILSLICGLLTVLNQTTIAGIGFNLPTAAQTTVTLVLGAFTFLGIGPIVGPKFEAALKLPPKVVSIISILLLVGLVVAQEDMTLPYRAVVIAVITVAGGLGFEPASVPVIP